MAQQREMLSDVGALYAEIAPQPYTAAAGGHQSKSFRGGRPRGSPGLRLRLVTTLCCRLLGLTMLGSYKHTQISRIGNTLELAGEIEKSNNLANMAVTWYRGKWTWFN